RLVIHDEDALVIEMEGAFRNAYFRRRDLAVTGAQIKRESRAFRRRVFQMEQTAVLFHNRVTDRQSKSCSSRLGRKIRIKNLCPQFIRYPGATICDGDLDVVGTWKNGTWFVLED